MKKNKIIMTVALYSILLLWTGLPSKAAHGAEENLTYSVNMEEEAVITGGRGTGTEINIPSVIDGYPVAGIEEGAFQDRADIEKVSVQSGVRYIGEYAFAGCTGLAETELEEGLQYIADNAFCGAISLGSIILPDSVVYVGKNAFGNCAMLARIEYPQTAHIDEHAFEGSLWQEKKDNGKFRIRGSMLVDGRNNEDPVLEIPYGVTKIADYGGNPGTAALSQYDIRYEQVILPDTLTELGTGCFKWTLIDRIKIPDGVKRIPKWAFAQSGLGEILLPKGLESIGESAFYGCSGLREIKIPDSLELIEYGAFSDCDGLSRVTIPGSVRSIEAYAFSGCDNLTEIVFEEGLTEVSGSFIDYCASLERLQLPESLENMEGWMFCPNLKSVYIPGGASCNLNDSIIRDYEKLDYSFTVYGQEGSRAQEIAELLGLEFKEVENGNEMP